MGEKWFRKSYRRHFRDLHIAEWDDKFLSEMNQSEIVKLIYNSEMNAATLFANTHTGLCNYPTFTDWYYDNFPESRTVDASGEA